MSAPYTGMTNTNTTRKTLDADIYAPALQILPTLRPTEPDDDCLGMVGELGGRALPATVTALHAAGYDVSDSEDEDGRRFVWVTARELA